MTVAPIKSQNSLEYVEVSSLSEGINFQTRTDKTMDTAINANKYNNNCPESPKSVKE